MDEASAREVAYLRIEHEEQLQAAISLESFALEVTQSYMDIIAEPGWADAATYFEVAAAGAGLFLAATPVGWIGMTVSAIGFGMISYGLMGSASYTVQALSRTSPQFPGAAFNLNAGRQFDSTWTAVKTPSTGHSLVDAGIDHLRDSATEHAIELIEGKSTDWSVTFPTFESTKHFMEMLERTLEENKKQLEKLQNEGPSKQPEIQPNAPIDLKLLGNSSSEPHGPGNNEHWHSDGNTFAGGDKPGEDTRSIA